MSRPRSAHDPREDLRFDWGVLAKPPVPVEAEHAFWFAAGQLDDRCAERLPEAELDFEQAYAGRSGVHRAERGETRVAKLFGEDGDPNPFLVTALKRRDDQSAINYDIAEQGFLWGGNSVDRGWVAPFVEHGFRSSVCHVMRRLHAALPRDLKAGPTKDYVEQGVGKWGPLYRRYVEADGPLRSLLRVDLDRDFPSWLDLHQQLHELYRAGELPCLPHLSVAARHQDGVIRHPHLIWLLPADGAVSMDRRRRAGPRNLLKAVEAGLIRALAHLGADRGGACLSTRFKNPFCPLHAVGVFNQSCYLRLEEMAAGLRDCSPLSRDARQAAAEISGLDVERSNHVFEATRRLAWRLVARMHNLKSASYVVWLGDRARMASELGNLIAPTIVDHYVVPGSKLGRENQVRSIVRLVCEHLADEWDADLAKPPPNRGIMTAEGIIHPDDHPTVKRSKAAKRTNDKQVSESVRLIAGAIRSLGSAADGAAVVRFLDGARSSATVYRWYGVALASLSLDSHTVVGKKNDPSPGPIPSTCGPELQPDIDDLLPVEQQEAPGPGPALAAFRPDSDLADHDGQERAQPTAGIRPGQAVAAAPAGFERPESGSASTVAAATETAVPDRETCCSTGPAGPVRFGPGRAPGADELDGRASAPDRPCPNELVGRSGQPGSAQTAGGRGFRRSQGGGLRSGIDGKAHQAAA